MFIIEKSQRLFKIQIKSHYRRKIISADADDDDDDDDDATVRHRGKKIRGERGLREPLLVDDHHQVHQNRPLEKSSNEKVLKRKSSLRSSPY